MRGGFRFFFVWKSVFLKHPSVKVDNTFLNDGHSQEYPTKLFDMLESYQVQKMSTIDLCIRIQNFLTIYI